MKITKSSKCYYRYLRTIASIEVNKYMLKTGITGKEI